MTQNKEAQNKEAQNKEAQAMAQLDQLKVELTPFISFSKRELFRIFRVWRQTLVPPIITPILFILIFGYSLGNRISEISGFTYIQFIFPGLLMMSIINSAYSNSSASLYIAKFQGNIQEVLVAPMSYLSIIGAYCLASLTRSLVVAVGIIFIGSFFLSISFFNLFIMLYFMLLTPIFFSLAGVVTSLWAQDFEQMNMFSIFIITPLTFLGGVFYSIDMLPSLWYKLSLFNPIYYFVDGFRYAYLGTSSSPVWLSMLVLLALTLLLLSLATYLFKIGYKIRS